MRIRKAVITAAGRNQRALPLQTLIDRDGTEKTVLRVIVEEALLAQVDELCIVVSPGDESAYQQAAGGRGSSIRFIEQRQPLGYGNSVYCARDFVGQDPFLHLVGDHLYVHGDGDSCARHLVQVAESQSCSVSLVQPTRENLLPNYGAVGGPKVSGFDDLYRVETVIEKPTPTEAEQRLIVPAMRAGHYLCFFGMHVLTPSIMDILGRQLERQPSAALSPALAELARHEQYLALESRGRRYDVGVKYGLLRAQLALALSGSDRAEVLSQLLELLATRNLESGRAGQPA
jgi:UTP--glucose-1-phosphate uridylyltransferase